MASLALPHVLPRVDDRRLEYKKYLNLLLALMARRGNDAEVQSNPFEVTVDPSTICQLKCPYCEVGNGTIRRPRLLLSLSTHQGFSDALAEDMFIAWYFSTGEPLINRRFAEVVSGIRGHGVFPIVSTNLSLRLSDKRIDELVTCGLGVICVSIDGATPETYSRYRVGGDFHLVMENMSRLLRRRRELGLTSPLIEWRFLVFRHNQHEIARARELAREIGVDLLEFFPGSAPRDAGPEEVQSAEGADLSPASSGPALDKARSRTDTTLRRVLQGAADGFGGAPEALLGKKCDWLYFGSMLFPNGSVSPCCVSNNEPDDFGRIDASIHFRNVWNNERFREARAMFANGASSDLICGRCPMPAAQDYQFRTSLRALLRNSPDWVLWTLSQAPSRFFFDVDFALSPTELEPIRRGDLPLDSPFPAAIAYVEATRQLGQHSPAKLDAIRDLLAAAP